MSEDFETRQPPFYPDCRHPNVDLTYRKCIYCGKPLSPEEVKERLSEGWRPEKA